MAPGVLALEKVPFLLLSLASSVVTYLVQREGGAFSIRLDAGERIANAFVSIVLLKGRTKAAPAAWNAPDVGAPAFRAGYATLVVSQASRRLGVVVAPRTPTTASCARRRSIVSRIASMGRPSTRSISPRATPYWSTSSMTARSWSAGTFSAP